MNSLCVAPDKVTEIWPHVSRFIEWSFADDRGDDNAETVRADLLDGHSLLWIAWDGRAIVAAVTTKLLSVRRGKICRITTCGGTNLKSWKAGLAMIEAYAKAEGCNLMRFEGRKGFARIFPEYRQPWIVLEKRLDAVKDVAD